MNNDCFLSNIVIGVIFYRACCWIEQSKQTCCVKQHEDTASSASYFWLCGWLSPEPLHRYGLNTLWVQFLYETYWLVLHLYTAVKPGQKIVQTRRSIDFDPNDPLLKSSDATEEVTAALKTLRTGEVSPSFIIIGIANILAWDNQRHLTSCIWYVTIIVMQFRCPEVWYHIALRVHLRASTWFVKYGWCRCERLALLFFQLR